MTNTQEFEQIVEVLIQRRLVVPAIFLLELSKPLVGCVREVSSACEPLLRMLVGERLLAALTEVFSSGERVEALISRLECVRDGVTK
jgi:hypothetical protein